MNFNTYKPINILIILVVFVGTFSSCTDKKHSVHPYIDYFYPIEQEAKIYLYRDIANGLDEQFQRIYNIKDSYGEHLVVETYAADGRIIEALNYNIDSLDLMDHMVVNRKQEKTKSELFKNKIIPVNKNEEVWFASRFQGFLDSTMILKEIKRKVHKASISHEVLGAMKPTIVFKDKIRMTNFNPFTKQENVISADALVYFSEDYGLVEWHSLDKKAHYKLEKILTQKEWLKIITR